MIVIRTNEKEMRMSEPLVQIMKNEGNEISGIFFFKQKTAYEVCQ